MTNKTIATVEQMKSLEAGQWVLLDDGKAACLFDTHMGFPQRMWGMKTNGGTRGSVRSFVALDGITLPLHLADIEASKCEHWTTNECGQCNFCGLPNAGEAYPVQFVDVATGLIRSVAKHNTRIKEDS